MNALTEIETLYVLKLTRLEAAKALVDPKELQVALRGMLSPADAATGAPRSGEPTSQTLRLPGALLPTTKKLMRKFKKQGQRKPCPHCGKAYKPAGLALHITKAHPEQNGHEPAPAPAPLLIAEEFARR